MAWVVAGNLKGPQGDRGVAGRDGVDGIRGEKGESGSDGVDGAPGRDGVDGLVDPDLAPVKPEPDLSDEVVIVDGGVVKRSPWSAFKVRIALWLTDLEAVWSKKTLTDPVLLGSVDLNGDVRLVASTTVASGFYRLRLENKNRVPFAVFQNSASENFKTRLQVNVDEAANVVRFQALSNATPADNSANTGIDLFPMGSGVVTARNVPVVTTTAAQSLANKTLTFPTLTSPLLNDPTLNNPAINAKMVEVKDSGETLFRVTGWSTGDPEGYVEVRTARNDFPFVQIGAESDSLADVGIALAPKGKGAVTVNVGAAISPTGSARTFPVGVKTTVPPTSTTAGAPGMWAEDDNHLYIYTGDGTAHAWRRAALQTW